MDAGRVLPAAGKPCKTGSPSALVLLAEALPAFILRIRWTQAAGCMEAWPQNPQCMDTDNSCYHPGTSSKAMPSFCHMCEQFLRVYQTFLPLLLHLILRKSLWIWRLLFCKWGYKITWWLIALIKVTQPVSDGVWMQTHVFLIWNPLLLTDFAKP